MANWDVEPLLKSLVCGSFTGEERAPVAKQTANAKYALQTLSGTYVISKGISDHPLKESTAPCSERIHD